MDSVGHEPRPNGGAVVEPVGDEHIGVVAAGHLLQQDRVVGDVRPVVVGAGAGQAVAQAVVHPHDAHGALGATRSDDQVEVGAEAVAALVVARADDDGVERPRGITDRLQRRVWRVAGQAVTRRPNEAPTRLAIEHVDPAVERVEGVRIELDAFERGVAHQQHSWHRWRQCRCGLHHGATRGRRGGTGTATHDRER